MEQLVQIGRLLDAAALAIVFGGAWLAALLRGGRGGLGPALAALKPAFAADPAADARAAMLAERAGVGVSNLPLSAYRDTSFYTMRTDALDRFGTRLEQRFRKEQVAEMMRVSKMTVYRMVHAGELPAVRVGRSFRVPESAVEDYLRESFIETA